MYPGKYCEAIDLSNDKLSSGEILLTKETTVTNGLVVELHKFAVSQKLPATKVIEWLIQIQPDLKTVKPATIRTKFTRVVDTVKKISKKKKLSAYKSPDEFLASIFVQIIPPKIETHHDERAGQNNMETTETETQQNISPQCNPSPEKVKCKLPSSETTPHKVTVHQRISEEEKFVNETKYEIIKKQRELKSLQKVLSSERETLDRLKSAIGHYSKRNIQKRDARAQKQRQELRDARMTITKQDRVLNDYARKTRKLRKVNKQLKNDLMNRNYDSDIARRSILNSEEHVQQLFSENESLKQKLEDQYSKTSKKTQSVNYFKRNLNKLKFGTKSNDTVKRLNKTLVEKEKTINTLLTNVEVLQEKLADNCRTRNVDGSFNDGVRLCVIELAGLEVAVEKIPKVIQSVSRHMFSRSIVSSDLPSNTTTQTIVDEGHFIAKKFIATKIDDCEHFGFNRDGTTRKKQKILDTSVTLDSGEIMSLGFTRVAHETAKTINEVTKTHVEEMSDIQTKGNASNCEEHIKSTLQKLSFSMSDRASNEKAANKLLDEWRDSIIQENPDSETLKIKHFYCMAHVLLGFHKYACDDVKKLEKELVAEKGPLGRDALDQFKTWGKGGTVIERVVRTVSDTFAPAGDHLGLRDRWEAHCCENGIKSVVGNYKDNRFNGIFQTSAEVLHHRNNMIHVLNTVKQPNRKLVSVKADLQCETICALLQCFALFYLRVTGPYWDLVTSDKVPYLQLYSHIQSLVAYLKKVCDRPEILHSKETTWENGVTDLQNGKLYESDTNELVNTDVHVLNNMIRVVSGAMLRCIEKQLNDFLPGGQFSQEPSPEDLKRTGYAQSTNLGCEHHFGDLDSSQKRRPNASMHHHSSIQLLKRNRNKMIEWLSQMSPNDKNQMLKQARKEGKTMRKNHLDSEKSVLKEIHNDMINEKEKKSKKRKRQEVDIETDDEFEIRQESYNLNEYVAVAYQDGWYPGIVEKTCEDCIYVNFLATTRKPGHFAWPARKDVQRVALEFVIKHGFVPECKNSGRLWFICEHTEIDKAFVKYSKIYF